MALKIGKRDVQRLAAVLDSEYDSVEQAAEAALGAAWELYEAKAKFVVASQLFYSQRNGGWLTPEDAAASKVVLGPYGTEKQAQAHAESLFYSSATHEQAKSWVIPMWHGTPAAYYGERNARVKKAALDERGEGINAYLDEYNRRAAWLRAHPELGVEDVPPPDDEPEACDRCGQELPLGGHHDSMDGTVAAA